MIRAVSPIADIRGCMSRRSLLAGLPLALALLPVGGRPSQAADEAAAMRFVDALGRQAIGIMQQPISVSQREGYLRELLRQGFDLGFIARFVLGRAYSSLTPEQAGDYFEAFSEFVLRSYARRLAAYQVRGFTITGARAAGDADSVVATRIEPANGQHIACEWRVREANQRHGIIDLTLEGVSMAVTQRNEFASLVNAQGVPGLIAVLRARSDRETVGASR